jgi:hypothetical protein
MLMSLLIIALIMCASLTVRAAETLPQIYLVTFDGARIDSKSSYTAGTIRIDDPKYGIEETQMDIKLRGNSTAYQSKSPYHIKLLESLDLFGMGSNKHWLLLADALDRSHLRNRLAFDLARELGMDYVESVYAEVYLNERYIGLYLFCEQIRISEDRVDIFNWDDIAVGKDMEQDLDWIDPDEYDITGGYLIENDEYYDEVSKFITSHEQRIMIKQPEYTYTNTAMMDYLQKYFADTESALYSRTGYTPTGVHYSDFIDFDSFLDFWIIFETFKNVELQYKSCYMYKDVGGKLIFGPVWDFDWSSGNHIVLHSDSRRYDTWFDSESQNRKYWYKQLFDEPYFMTKLTERWYEVQDKITAMIDSIAVYETQLQTSVDRNIKIWGRADNMNFNDEAKALRDWLTGRVEWMNEQFAKANPDIMNMGYKTDGSIDIAARQNGGAAEISVNTTEVDTYSVYINNHFYKQITDTVYNEAIPTDENAELFEFGKKNVVIVYSSDLKKMNFTVFEMEGKPPEAVITNADDAAEIADSTVTPTTAETGSPIPIILVAAVAGCGGCAYFLRKKVAKTVNKEK